MSYIIPVLAIGALPALLTAAAVFDLATMTIPNRLNIALAFAFLPAAAFAGLPFEALAMHFAAGAVFLAIGVTFFALGWMGGGDAKLMAAIGLWLDPQAAVIFVFIAAMGGGALTLALLSFRQLPLPALAVRQSWILRLHDQRAGVPYGIALAAGGAFAFTNSTLFAALLPWAAP